MTGGPRKREHLDDGWYWTESPADFTAYLHDAKGKLLAKVFDFYHTWGFLLYKDNYFRKGPGNWSWFQAKDAAVEAAKEAK